MLYTHLSLSLSLIWYSIFLWRLSILRQMTILRGTIVAMPGIAAPPSASWVSCKVLLRRSRSERRWGDQDKWRIMENQKWVNPFCCIYNVLLLYIPYIYISIQKWRLRKTRDRFQAGQKMTVQQISPVFFWSNQKFIDFNSKKHVQHVSPAKEVFSLVKLRSLE